MTALSRLRHLAPLALGLAGLLALPAASPAQDPFAFEDAPTAAVSDPLEGFNRAMLKVNRSLGKFVLRPLDSVYRGILPDPVETGVANVFDNLGVVPRVAGNLLQGRFDGALKETGRFAVDTTVGLGGFFRPSAEMDALKVSEEDLGQAFGAWGIGEGPYLVLPLLGPTTLRDLVGRVADSAVHPLETPFSVFEEWEHQAAYDGGDFLAGLPGVVKALDAIEQDAIDPYVAIRSGIVNYRRAKVAE